MCKNHNSRYLKNDKKLIKLFINLLIFYYIHLCFIFIKYNFNIYMYIHIHMYMYIYICEWLLSLYITWPFNRLANSLGCTPYLPPPQPPPTHWRLYIFILMSPDTVISCRKICIIKCIYNILTQMGFLIPLWRSDLQVRIIL